MRNLYRGLICGVILWAFPAVAAAQGSIAGSVRDTSGAVLPGVTVEAASPVLIEKVRAAVTDGSGRYRIESVLGKKRALEVEIEAINAGGGPMLAQMAEQARAQMNEQLFRELEQSARTAVVRGAAFGFVTYGIEPDAYKLDGRYWDSEMMTLDLRQSVER